MFEWLLCLGIIVGNPPEILAESAIVQTKYDPFHLYADHAEILDTPVLFNHQKIKYVLCREGESPDREHVYELDLPWTIDPKAMPNSVVQQDVEGVIQDNPELSYRGKFWFDKLNRIGHFDGTIYAPFGKTRVGILGVKFTFSHEPDPDLSAVILGEPLIALPISEEDMSREMASPDEDEKGDWM